MTIETIFGVGGAVVIAGWLALLAGLFVRPWQGALFAFSGLILPAAYSAVYVGLFVKGLTSAPMDLAALGTLKGLEAVFSQDLPMTTGWFHYLAFDLVIGTWIARDGLLRGVWPIALVPFAFFTFMAGPIGFLAYLILRAALLRGKRAAPLLSAAS